LIKKIMKRCIKCNSWIRFDYEVDGIEEIGNKGSGNDMKVGK
jgi:NADH dehydrogenase/NADH:ubiquinone oxidoreductase subunit G